MVQRLLVEGLAPSTDAALLVVILKAREEMEGRHKALYLVELLELIALVLHGLQDGLHLLEPLLQRLLVLQQLARLARLCPPPPQLALRQLAPPPRLRPIPRCQIISLLCHACHMRHENCCNAIDCAEYGRPPGEQRLPGVCAGSFVWPCSPAMPIGCAAMPSAACITKQHARSRHVDIAQSDKKKTLSNSVGCPGYKQQNLLLWPRRRRT